MKLPLETFGIQNAAAIVDRHEAKDFDRAGFRVDFDLADITAIRIVGRRRSKCCGGAQAEFRVGIDGCSTVRGSGNRIQRDVTVRASYAEMTGVECDVFDIGF